MQFTTDIILVALEHIADLEKSSMGNFTSKITIFTCKQSATLQFTGLMMVLKRLSAERKDMVAHVLVRNKYTFFFQCSPFICHYPAHKLEFLSLKWAVSEKCHEYLYGNAFEVVTDNNPLT